MNQLSKILFKNKPTIEAYKKGLEKHKKEIQRLFQSYISVGHFGDNHMAKEGNFAINFFFKFFQIIFILNYL